MPFKLDCSQPSQSQKCVPEAIVKLTCGVVEQRACRRIVGLRSARLMIITSLLLQFLLVVEKLAHVVEVLEYLL